MKTDLKKIIIEINLPKNFNTIIEKNMNEEFIIAQKKWNINIDKNQKENIFKHSLKQLEYKIQELTKTTWKIGDPIHVKVNSEKEVETGIILPNKKYVNSDIHLIRLSDGWKVDFEKRKESIHLKNFTDFFKEFLIKSSKTAVFYGVSSYK